MKEHKLFLFRICLLIQLFGIQIANAQDSTDPSKQYIPNITIAPPQVASMSKVGEIPVDISTGRLNYTIPIFEITEGSFKMPINLSYNYSGLQVDETPGYGGVGWTFNIGGSILHTINGLNDENHENDKQYVHNYINNLSPYEDQTTLGGIAKISQFLESISNGIFDGEPDKFTVNAGNINCSFYLDKDNNPIFLKNENYKVSGKSFNGFTITDDQGINYIFNLSQTADKVTENNQYSYNTSFLITEINFPFTSNKILFEYTNPIQYNDTFLNQSLTQTTNEYGNPNNNFKLKTNTTYTIINSIKLKKIITNSYTIELQYDNNPNEPAITVINNLKIKDKKDNIIKNYDFEFSPWFGRRINLLNVKYNGVIINQMEYDMSTSYPTSSLNNYHLKKDLWGYYNINATPVTSVGLTDPYANSSIKPDFSSTKIGSLKKISYQTKGYSLIDYEPNSALVKSSNYNFPYDADSTIITMINARTSANNGISEEKTFIVSTVPSEINIVSTLTNHTQINSYEDRSAEVLLFKEDQIINPIYKTSQDWLRELTWIPQTAIFTVTKKIIINEVGTYHIKANSSIGSSASIGITIKQRPEEFNQTIGGIRVKQIQNCELNNQCITTIYNYTQSGNSTGIILQKPKFYSGYYIHDALTCAGTNGNYVRQDFYNYTSIYPLSNFRGSPVLYGIVEKIDTNGSANNGKTIFSYYGESSSNSLQDENSIFINGLLDSKIIKNEINTSLSNQKYTYLMGKIRDTPKYVYALESKIVLNRFYGTGTADLPTCTQQYPRPLNNYISGRFKHEARNYVLQKEEDKRYFNNDSLAQTTTSDYNLDTNLLKSQTTTNSKGDTKQTKYFYPQDPQMASEPFATDLIAKNIIAEPLKTETYRNTEKLSENLTEYTKTTDNLLLPKYVYANKGTTAIVKSADKKITYDQYDNKGNIQQYTSESGTPVSIIWGYNQTQPIAKIENATYSSITASLITAAQTASDTGTEATLLTALTNLRNDTSLANAMVTTYTHIPLIGVSTITDPKGNTITYTYDAFGRLQFVKDKNGNLLSENEYHYKP